MLANLSKLDRLYRNASTVKEGLFYSKLALLELCGWIEESMDDIVMRCCIRCVRDERNRKFIRKQVVERTYGFEYDKHFRKMLISMIGVIGVERLERKIPPQTLAQLKATLHALELARNPEAHTHIKGVTRRIDAPSAMLQHFTQIFTGLKEYERVVRTLW